MMVNFFKSLLEALGIFPQYWKYSFTPVLTIQYFLSNSSSPITEGDFVYLTRDNKIAVATSNTKTIYGIALSGSRNKKRVSRRRKKGKKK